VREITRAGAPLSHYLARRKIDETTLAAEISDRGDAYRALRSLLDSVERDRISAAEAHDEMRRRARDLVESLR
jgi:hypothetical protein